MTARELRNFRCVTSPFPVLLWSTASYLGYLVSFQGDKEEAPGARTDLFFCLARWLGQADTRKALCYMDCVGKPPK